MSLLDRVNTYATGYAGIAVALLTLAANQQMRDAVLALFKDPSPTNWSAAIGMIATGLLLYFGHPAGTTKTKS